MLVVDDHLSSAFVFAMTPSDWIQVGIASVLTVTLLVVLWYAWETRKQAAASVQMAKAMREQTLAEDRPFLLVEVMDVSSTRFAAPDAEEEGPNPLAGYPVFLRYRLFNAGRGPAKEIGTSIRHPNARYEGSSKDVLRAGDSWDVEITLQNEAAALITDSFAESPSRGLNDFLVEVGAPPLEAGYDCGVVVRYTDIHDLAYLTFLRFGMIAVTDNVRRIVTSRTIRPIEQRVVPTHAQNGGLG